MLSEAAVTQWETETQEDAGAARRARITRLTVTDFRSYPRAEIGFDGRPAAISGANGAGKTNILEAISLLGPGRGVRGAKLDELPRIGGAGGWAVSARVDDGEDERRFGVGAAAANPSRRICRIDDADASGPGALAEHLRFMWLTPAQDRLFMEGAGERRRFLDRMTLAHDPAHGKRSTGYEQAMRQRQRLLEEGGRDEGWLGAVEKQMAEAGVAIAAARRAMVSRLAAAEVASEESVFPCADIALDGALETALAAAARETVEADFAEGLRAGRRRDAEAGRALSGPHRSDLLVTHREKGRPAKLCSTGEQKALLIGLVLANARALSLSDPNAPLILLLDEIAAHLDEGRRAALFSILDDLGFQAFMTGTDKSLFEAWGPRAQHFDVSGGAVHETQLTS
ncbi:DNA replication/repair protein RecF [Hyphococcus luteus]|uniref:DNA replication and repair protein RecF n=1 Tax=Hyphococcus luteus TaxID=2058213 RepID=A0A2S7K844_9PROT|nr:DNA replication/repair protein RecF [Marinicaulis flavus]PQA88684.1 DNA replication/repair protein RecF [Marinicaulis flavus]